jgi:hypothetical protein
MASKNVHGVTDVPGWNTGSGRRNPAAGYVFVTRRKGIVVDREFPEYTDSSATRAVEIRGTFRGRAASKLAGKE